MDNHRTATSRFLWGGGMVLQLPDQLFRANFPTRSIRGNTRLQLAIVVSRSVRATMWF